VCFYNEGSSNIFEQLSMHDGKAIGFYLTKGSNNLVLNCDAYRNWDNVSETGRGGNVDGFGGHPGKGGTGNVFRGCRAWFNSDDGYDCINAYESIVFENCWAFENGYSTTFASLGDGNGFKAGGYGQAPVVSGLPSPIPSHTVRFCLSYRNKANGIYANHHVQTGNHFYNNTAYRNGTNYNMLSQQITKSTKTGNDTTLDCAGFNHILHNNLSYRYSTQTETANLGTCINTYNSFSPNSGVTVDANDFLSIDEALLIAPRQADGSLPDINFLKLKEGSDLIDKGMDLGFTFVGATPDLGAFESNYSTGISSVTNEEQIRFYPNPVQNIMYFSQKANLVEVIDIAGKLILTDRNVNQINLSALQNGIYLIRLKLNENNNLIRKFIKY
ncbi:MAG: T9SS type A sorting domain-containing protein, partial [Paludibacter sp.]